MAILIDHIQNVIQSDGVPNLILGLSGTIVTINGDPVSTSTFNVTTSDINTTGTLQTGLFGIENATPQIELLVEQNGDYWDKLFVRLDANSSASGKERTDLLKFYNENVNVYTIGNDDTRMAIDARNVLSTIPLGISADCATTTI